MRRVHDRWICRWRGRRKRRGCVDGERVRVGDLLDGHGFLGVLLLALLVLLVHLQLRRRRGLLDHDGGVLLQVLASRGLGQHDEASAVHPRCWPEVQLAPVLPPAFELGVVLALDVASRHWDFENLQKRSEMSSERS